MPQPAIPGQPGCEHAPDGRLVGPRIQRALLRVRAEHVGELGFRRAGTNGDREVGRLVGDDTRGCVHCDGIGTRRIPDFPVRAPAYRDHRFRAAHGLGQLVDGGGDGHQIHAPSGTRCISPQRLPLGSTF